MAGMDAIDDFILPIVHAFIEVSNMQLSNNCSANLVLISRRSRFRAGMFS